MGWTITWAESRAYIRGLKKYIWLSAGLFFIASILGFMFAKQDPFAVDALLKNFKQSLSSLVDLPPLNLAIVIFLNNGLKTLAMIVLGVVFGIYPALSLFGNGYLIGIIAYIAQSRESWQLFFASVVPHGILELPLVILAGAMGLRLGVVLAKRLLGNKHVTLKKDFNEAVRFALFIIIPLVCIAAFIESFITPLFISFI